MGLEIFVSLLLLTMVMVGGAITIYQVSLWIKQLVSFVSKRDKRTENILTSKFVQRNSSPNNEMRNGLVHAWINNTNNPAYTTRGTYTMLAIEPFLEELKKMYKVTIHGEWCDLTKTSCSVIAELIGPEKGTVIMLGFTTNQRNTRDYKNRPMMKFVGDVDIDQYINDDKEILMVETIEIVHGVNQDKSEDVALLETLIEAWQLDYITYAEEYIDKSHKVYRLTQVDGNYDLMPTRLSVDTSYPIDVLYDKVMIEFGGERHAINMSDAVEITKKTLLGGTSAAIFGVAGTGKSRLMQYIQHGLEKDNSGQKVRIIQITPGMIQELQLSSAQSALIRLLKPESDGEHQYVNVFCIDEAETALVAASDRIHTVDNTLLLQMMDGELQRQLNCAVLCIFNAKPTNLNTAVFRRNRLGIVLELKPLAAERARKLVEIVQFNHPEKVMDTKQFNQLLFEINRTVSGEIYAVNGEITVADVFSCLRNRNLHHEIVKAIRKAADPVANGKAPVQAPTVEIEVEPNTEEAAQDEQPAAAPVNNTIKRHKENRRRKRR